MPIKKSIVFPIVKTVVGVSTPSTPTYLHEDLFADTDVSPITSPRVLSVGQATIVQTDGTFSVGSGKLTVTAQSTPAWGDLDYLVTSPAGVSRAAGQIFKAKVNVTGDEGVPLQARNAATAGYDSGSIHAFRVDGTALYAGPQSGQVQVAVISTGVEYDLAIVLRATGAHYLIKGGGFTDWTLLLVQPTQNAATVYPNATFLDFAGTIDEFRVVNPAVNLWVPTPLISDSFDRADSATVGNSDGAGVEESGGGSLAWSTLSGSDAGRITSNRHVNSASGGTGGISVRDLGVADVVGRATIRWTTGGSSVGFIIRATDNNNRWNCDLANGVTLRILKIEGGVITTEASATVSTSANTDIELRFRAVGSLIEVYLGTTRVAKTGATFNQTETQHGVGGYHATTIGGSMVGDVAYFDSDQSSFPSV